jgi:hypothetical protein
MNDQPLQPEDEREALWQGFLWGLAFDAFILAILFAIWGGMR